MQFYFSAYSSILLIFFVQGMVYAALLWSRGINKGQLPDKLLALTLLICSLHIAQWMLGFAGWYDSRDFYTSIMFYFPWHQFLFLGPLVYFYFLSRTNHSFEFKRKYWLHFMPGLLILAIHFIVFFKDVVIDHWARKQPFPIFDGTKGHWAQWDTNQFIYGLEQISLIIYLTLTLRAYYHYRKYIRTHFVDTTIIEYKWIRNSIYVVLAALAFNFIFSILSAMLPEGLDYQQVWFSHFGIGLMVYILAIQGYRSYIPIERKLTFNIEVQDRANFVNPSSKVDELDYEQWKENLAHIMQEKKLFLQQDLSLHDMASECSTNTSVMSKIINQVTGTNFNDFVNRHRIEEVERRFKNGDHEKWTLMSIAYDSGFNSKATFNRAFKKFTGKTPRQYIQSLPS